VQVVLALVVTPEGFPLGYEVLPGNTLDKKTLNSGLAWVEKQYGKVRRVWVIKRVKPLFFPVSFICRIDAAPGRLRVGSASPSANGSSRF